MIFNLLTMCGFRLIILTSNAVAGDQKHVLPNLRDTDSPPTCLLRVSYRLMCISLDTYNYCYYVFAIGIIIGVCGGENILIACWLPSTCLSITY